MEDKPFKKNDRVYVKSKDALCFIKEIKNDYYKVTYADENDDNNMFKAKKDDLEHYSDWKTRMGI